MSDSHQGWAGGSTGGSGPHGARPLGLRALWDGLRCDAAPPRRDRIDPRALGPMLERVVLIDHLAHRLTRIRIAGRDVVDLAGRELRGMPFPVLFRPEDRPRLVAALEQVFAQPAVLDIGVRIEGGFPRQSGQWRLQVLPLVAASGRVEQAICGLTGTRPLPFAATLRVERMFQERLSGGGAAPAVVSGRAAPQLRLVQPATDAGDADTSPPK